MKFLSLTFFALAFGGYIPENIKNGKLKNFLPDFLTLKFFNAKNPKCPAKILVFKNSKNIVSKIVVLKIRENRVKKF